MILRLSFCKWVCGRSKLKNVLSEKRKAPTKVKTYKRGQKFLSLISEIRLRKVKKCQKRAWRNLNFNLKSVFDNIKVPIPRKAPPRSSKKCAFDNKNLSTKESPKSSLSLIAPTKEHPYQDFGFYLTFLKTLNTSIIINIPSLFTL